MDPEPQFSEADQVAYAQLSWCIAQSVVLYGTDPTPEIKRRWLSLYQKDAAWTQWLERKHGA